MKFVKGALNWVTKDEQTIIELQEITSLSMQKRRESAEQELERIWEDERRQPITYNHYYTDNIQNARHERTENAIEDALDRTIGQDNRGFVLTPGGDNSSKLRAALKGSVNVDMDDQACTEALIGLKAYYKVYVGRHRPENKYR